MREWGGFDSLSWIDVVGHGFNFSKPYYLMSPASRWRLKGALRTNAA
ncbi:hypothetical protein CPBP_00150 [Candidatus Bodocaedibacter vickermanii]|uniref:Uncharacterized protein n=1 Tax=Candidatus Bodocaedibacter vickermanii TaxID=2741701 RepID=A0A7L9RSM7_9PROT|nr:hypothetical protein CPBP_00150 [Candidatus Paracaedibacteraceae bacterium 'Lake Konstanz']